MHSGNAEVSKALKKIYYSQDMRFPIIGAVIEGKAEGLILCNNPQSPTHVFVLHKFGFCQEMYMEYEQEFLDEQIIPFIQNNKEKLRLYNPQGELAKYLEQLPYALVAMRRHYVYKNLTVNGEKNFDYEIRPMNCQDLEREDFGLDLATRYYKGAEEFIENALPFVAVSKENECLAVIYSAGNDKDMCEIDIFTKEAYRRQGIGEQLVNRFVKECHKRGKIPTWDCYSNLQQSKMLAEKCGFTLKEEYNFYNIKQ